MAGTAQPDRHPAAVLHWPLLLGSLSVGFLTFALPIYGKALQASALEIGGLFAIFSVAVAVLRPLVGWMLDRLGRKSFLVAALVCYAISMALFASATSMPTLYLAQAVRGLGSAMLWITAYTLATDLAGALTYGEAVGRVDEAVARGSLLGGLLGFWLLTQLQPTSGWQLVFAGYAVLAAVGAGLAWTQVRETLPAPPHPGQRLSGRGRPLLKLLLVVLLTTGASSLLSPIVLIFLQDRFTTDVGTLVLAIIPAALVASFLPARLGHLSDRVGRTRVLAGGLLGAGVVACGLPSVPSVLGLTLLWAIESVGWALAGPAEAAMVADLTGQQVRGLSYGLYAFVASIGAAAGPLLGGWLYDTVGPAVPFYVAGAVLVVAAGLAWVLLGQAPVGRHALETPSL